VAIGPVIVNLADLLEGVPHIGIGKINCDNNVPDSGLFPETSIPNIKFFSAGHKTSPIKYDGKRDIESFLRFIHSNCQTKFELDQLIEKIPAILKKEEIRKKLTALKSRISNVLPLIGNLTQEQKLVWESNISMDENQPDACDEKMNLITPLIVHLENEKEKFDLKKVIKIHSVSEYNQIIATSNEKAVVVDFFATWCKPCVQISPLFAEFSESYSDCIFVKVDVDNLKEIAKTESVSAMPTFKVYKNGAVVDTLVGASVQKLKEMIEKNK